MKIIEWESKEMSGSKEASVHFSGGSDSTLAAAYLCENYDKVHLLNFHHSGMSHTEKSIVNVDRLRKKYGEEKIIFKQLDIENIFKKLYFDNYFNDLIKYRLFLAAGTCNTCLLSMHVKTILYNINNGVGFSCDGYKKEKEHIYVVMSQKGKEMLKELYNKYNIEYDTPVYDTLRTDWELFELGITPKKDVKFPYELLSYSSQHSCYHGILTNAYLLGYYYPTHSKRSAKWIEYLKEKMDQADIIIQDSIKTN